VYSDGKHAVSDTTGKVIIEACEDTTKQEGAGTSKGAAETTGGKVIKAGVDMAKNDEGAGTSKYTDNILKQERIPTSERDQVDNLPKKYIIKIASDNIIY
jgi:hypothetical protein